MAMLRGMNGSSTVAAAYPGFAPAQRPRQRSQQIARTHRRTGPSGAVSILQALLEYVPGRTQETPMQTDRPDPNSELATHEPLRIVFALAALLLGLIAALH
jgi:hypothetical protein